jgi:hypothetical protein
VTTLKGKLGRVQIEVLVFGCRPALVLSSSCKRAKKVMVR